YMSHRTSPSKTALFPYTTLFRSLLKANEHKVGIVSAGFSFVSPETFGRQYHYVLFTSDQPSIAAAALAWEGGSLTSYPVDALQRSEEHTSELQSRFDLVCRLLLE